MGYVHIYYIMSQGLTKIASWGQLVPTGERLWSLIPSQKQDYRIVPRLHGETFETVPLKFGTFVLKLETVSLQF